MKIETRDEVQIVPTPPKPRTDRGLAARASLAIALALCLLVALRWALGVTNANAQQLSTNLTHLQDRLDSPSAVAQGGSNLSARHDRTGDANPGDGPTLEPVDNR